MALLVRLLFSAAAGAISLPTWILAAGVKADTAKPETLQKRDYLCLVQCHVP